MADSSLKADKPYASKWRRGRLKEKMETAIREVQGGEPIDKTGLKYGISSRTLRRYVNDSQDPNSQHITLDKSRSKIEMQDKREVKKKKRKAQKDRHAETEHLQKRIKQLESEVIQMMNYIRTQQTQICTLMSENLKNTRRINQLQILQDRQTANHRNLVKKVAKELSLVEVVAVPADDYITPEEIQHLTSPASDFSNHLEYQRSQESGHK